MNLPPECEHQYEVRPGKCPFKAVWVIFCKTDNTRTLVCQRHFEDYYFEPEKTYVIFGAKDYSIHGGHDLPARKKFPEPRDRYIAFLQSQPKGGERIVCPVMCGKCCSSLDYTCSHLTETGCDLPVEERPVHCNIYLCEAAKRVLELERNLRHE